MTPLDRISKFEVDQNGCWLWAGAIAPNGYGKLSWQREDGRTHYAHRIAYEVLVGPVPADSQLDHLCRVRSCINPDHLEPVTQRENILRGVSPAAVHAQQTHCKWGHELTDDNTWVNPDTGARNCRTCLRRRASEGYHRRKQCR